MRKEDPLEEWRISKMGFSRLEMVSKRVRTKSAKTGKITHPKTGRVSKKRNTQNRQDYTPKTGKVSKRGRRDVVDEENRQESFPVGCSGGVLPRQKRFFDGEDARNAKGGSCSC